MRTAALVHGALRSSVVAAPHVSRRPMVSWGLERDPESRGESAAAAAVENRTAAQRHAAGCLRTIAGRAVVFERARRDAAGDGAGQHDHRAELRERGRAACAGVIADAAVRRAERARFRS